MNEKTINLLEKARNGDSNAMDTLLVDNKRLVSAVARKYYLISGEKEDLIQEGMIGLFRAITSFNAEKSDNFEGYAARLIEREIINAIRIANSYNNKLSDNAFPLDTENSCDSDSPENDIILAEQYKEIYEKIERALSGFEKEVIVLYLKGYSYTDIAEKLEKSPKSIDNALSRIKQKLNFLKE